MSKRVSYEIKKGILNAVREKGATYAQLERKLNTGYRTVKSNCEELAQFDLVDIEYSKEHPENGRPFHLITITEKGLEALAKKKK